MQNWTLQWGRGSHTNILTAFFFCVCTFLFSFLIMVYCLGSLLLSTTYIRGQLLSCHGTLNCFSVLFVPLPPPPPPAWAQTKKKDTNFFFWHNLLGILILCFLMKQVCHRDLKLENTLLDGSPAPRLKICDFGYSKVLPVVHFNFLFRFLSLTALFSFRLSVLCLYILLKFQTTILRLMVRRTQFIWIFHLSDTPTLSPWFCNIGLGPVKHHGFLVKEFCFNHNVMLK